MRFEIAAAIATQLRFQNVTSPRWRRRGKYSSTRLSFSVFLNGFKIETLCLGFGHDPRDQSIVTSQRVNKCDVIKVSIARLKHFGNIYAWDNMACNLESVKTLDAYRKHCDIHDIDNSLPIFLPLKTPYYNQFIDNHCDVTQQLIPKTRLPDNVLARRNNQPTRINRMPLYGNAKMKKQWWVCVHILSIILMFV